MSRETRIRTPRRPKGSSPAKNGAALGFEAKLWEAADKLRNNVDPALYKHVVLGLIFLKYISDAFEERRAWLLAATRDPASDYFCRTEAEREACLEDRDEYLGELIDLVATIGLGDAESRSKDVLGRVYEYFLGRFAGAEGKGGGEFYTPRYVVRLLVEMLQPFRGRVYDPCCGSGGMFVQSERFDPHLPRLARPEGGRRL